MEVLPRLHILLEEIREIVKTNKEFLESEDRGSHWHEQQHELRKRRLEEIKTELKKLMPDKNN